MPQKSGKKKIFLPEREFRKKGRAGSGGLLQRPGLRCPLWQRKKRHKGVTKEKEGISTEKVNRMTNFLTA